MIADIGWAAVAVAVAALSLVAVVLALRLGRERPVTRDEMEAVMDATREPRRCPDCVWWADDPDNPEYPLPVWRPCAKHDPAWTPEPEPSMAELAAWETEWRRRQQRGDRP